jgi:hypothetical protein
MQSKNPFSELINPSNVVVGIIGLTIIAIWGEYIYAFISSPSEITMRTHLIVILTIVIGLVGICSIRKKRHTPLYRWREGELLTPQKGLVVVLSTPGIIKTLLEHHGRELEHVWIIANLKNEAFGHFIGTQLKEYRQELDLTFDYYPIHFEDDIKSNAQVTYEKVRESCKDALVNRKLDLETIVVDITGGTKEMTAGVVLACSQHNLKMSYVRSQYEWDNDQKRSKRIPNSEKVLKFDVSFSRQ